MSCLQNNEFLARTHWNVTGMTDILERVGAVSEQMVQYRINKDELLLLQATVLVNAGQYRGQAGRWLYEHRRVTF